LVFTQHRDELTPELSKGEFTAYSSHNIGTLQGTTLYITDARGNLVGYNSAQWHVLYPLQSKALEKIEQLKRKATDVAARGEQQLVEMRHAVSAELKARLTFAQENPHKNDVAHVRIGNTLPPEEQAFIAQRLPRVKKALEKVLRKPLPGSFVPKIALLLSGGGYRAALASTGAFVALQELGLFDTLSYVVSLSGSTWALGPLMSTGLSIPAFRNYFIDTIVNNKGLANIGVHGAELIGQEILTRFLFDSPITIIDFYGGLMANGLLQYAGNERQRIYLSDQSKRINRGQMPLPIYTAVRADVYPETEWYEMNPFEIGGTWLGMYIPTWSYGRLFLDGVSINDTPELSLGFILATCGSAFAVTFNRLYEEIAGSIPSLTVRKIIEKLLTVVGEKRLFSSQAFNFTYGMTQSSIKEQIIMNMADAGIDFNLPYPPVSGQRPERMADIFIIIDVAAGLPGQELFKAENYARTHNLKFPRINRVLAEKQSMSIFRDENDPAVPVVIYLPFVDDRELWQSYKNTVGSDSRYENIIATFNPGYCTKSDVCGSSLIWQSYLHKLKLQGHDVSTIETPSIDLCKAYQFCSSFNFAYTKEQAEKLVSFTEFNIKAHAQGIMDVIAWKINQKR
jgi:phospholipase A2